MSGFSSCFDRMDELEQRISDVNNAALYDRSQLEERIDALEQRIEVLHRIAERHQATLDDLERRIEVLERKLNHKGVEQ